ncbi:MAG: aminopeptidase N [Micavibrio aeruginosavorus]|uniref:Aminopeptidase N n=1 Tax=Micavibrio aeruginosavorus TaxID=349221 RepID=A0A7T5R0S6_9BACT|nr:MAG: aminopeptidase N [Micavibrio aeruginosavorus]
MRTDTAPKTVYLKDYQAPLYRIESVYLTFKIFEEKTVVRSQISFTKNHDGNEPLVLNGEKLVLKSVAIDSKPVSDYQIDDKFLTIPSPGSTFTLETEVEIDPAGNTALEGLYKSGGNWCTQCEAEGFRKITYFPDRPDVMTVFTARVEGDRKTCPVLLSNGNLIEEGDLPDDRHYAIWHDPFPKPCYLFALVAGDLVYIQDHFKTMTGRNVDLRIYVRKGDEGQCAHAMESLIRSMKWDEDVYGREYQLDRFNIVAVSDFNMGAMENTSLNIFNTALVLAQPETATDTDYERVEGVIAHEYFHNWTGNRVTCRDWFQLSLKEGLTVFRDQEFSSDMNSRGVKRIDDVVLLRRMQFPEDAGPMAHPIRPDNYIEISNFYTVTVYEKGAEVIRMQHTLLSPETYRKATDLYFERYDGMAVTCDDFVQCMMDASGQDLSQFKLWYSQAGTPEISAKGSYDASSRVYTLELSQYTPPTPGQTEKKPFHIPVKVGLVGPNGADMAEELLHLKKEKQVFTFENIPSRPVPSILRNFSAPVKLKTDLSDEDLRFLMIHDSDGFNRWEAGHTLSLRLLNELIDKIEDGKGGMVDPAYVSGFGDMLSQALCPGTDKALLARSLNLPDIPIIAQHRKVVDTDSIHRAREIVMMILADQYRDLLKKVYFENHDKGPFSNDFEARSRRALKNAVLRYLSRADGNPAVALAKDQYDMATNMTDRVAALSVLSDTATPQRKQAFDDFLERFHDHMLVVDKWFSLQAAAVRPHVHDDVRALRRHPDFILTNPNRVRSLYGAFAMNNPYSFHERSGRGYDFLGESIIQLNAVNPQIAARLLTPLKEWRRYTPDRQEKMKEVLELIAGQPDLSPDVFEIVTKTLK